MGMLRSIFTVGAAVLWFSVTPTAAADFNFRVYTNNNTQSIHYAGLTKFKEIADAKAGGKIDVRLFHSGSLGDDVTVMQALQTGTLDIGTVDTPITTADELLGVFGLPYIFRDRDHVSKVMTGPVGELIAERLQKKGLKVLAYFEGGFRQITNNVRPIVKPEDLKGIKMRTPSSALRIKIFKHYGANASALPFPELYPALQTKVFDGQENPAIEVISGKFYEVQKYLSFTGHVYTISYFMMSDKVHAKLPLDLQKLLREAAQTAAKATVEAGIKGDAEVAEFAKSKGMQVNQADVKAFVEASKQIWDDFAKEQGSEAEKLIKMVTETK